jgi:hypothetical protein
MKYVYWILILGVLGLTGCSTERVRTKWTDPAGRVMVDPRSVSAEDYVSIVTALTQSGKWFVVDRSNGLRAIKAEQEMLHRNEVDRFDDQEKYALWGKLYGVGAVVVGTKKCRSFRGFTKDWTQCLQFLSIIDANSGEVIAAAKKDVESNDMSYPEWDDTVEALNDAFPKHWEPAKYDKEMLQYRAAASEHALRQKEQVVHQEEGSTHKIEKKWSDR